MTILIRRARFDDVDALLELTAELGYTHEDRERFETMFARIDRRDDMVIWVAEVEKVVGYCATSRKPQLRYASEVVEIDELCVSSHFRGSGVGTLLLNFVLQKARDEGAHHVMLQTRRSRVSYDRGFYKKAGFVEKDSAIFVFGL